MKKLALIIVTLIFSIEGFSQIYDPVSWTTSVKKISSTEYELEAIATIEGDWHLYSQSVPEGGPVPTSFTFESNGKYLKKGNTKEEKGTTVDDPIFNMKIKYFGHKATFKQRIKAKAKGAFKINATVRFMVCNDTQCLPPTVKDIVFEVK